MYYYIITQEIYRDGNGIGRWDGNPASVIKRDHGKSRCQFLSSKKVKKKKTWSCESCLFILERSGEHLRTLQSTPGRLKELHSSVRWVLNDPPLPDPEIETQQISCWETEKFLQFFVKPKWSFFFWIMVFELVQSDWWIEPIRWSPDGGLNLWQFLHLKNPFPRDLEAIYIQKNIHLSMDIYIHLHPFTSIYIHLHPFTCHNKDEGLYHWWIAKLDAKNSPIFLTKLRASPMPVLSPGTRARHRRPGAPGPTSVGL